MTYVTVLKLIKRLMQPCIFRKNFADFRISNPYTNNLWLQIERIFNYRPSITFFMIHIHT